MGKFNPKVESLRGLAASAVIVTHSLAVLPVNGTADFWSLPYLGRTFDQWLLTLLLIMSNAGAAVVLFFVISGYVLTLSLKDSSLLSYAVRRAFRLLPPMWVSIALFYLATRVLPPTRYEIPSLFDAAENLVMVSFKGNPVTWTMYVEMIGSIAIPALLAILAHFRMKAALPLIGAWLLGLATLYPSPTVSYLGCFACGIAACIFPRPQLPSRQLIGLGAAAFCSSLFLPQGPYWIIADTIGGYLVLSGVLALDERKSVLDTAPLRYLGRISYSLYLIQLPAILLMSWAAQRVGVTDWPWLLPHLSIAAGSLLLSVGAAGVLYPAVERPSIDAGKAVSKTLIVGTEKAGRSGDAATVSAGAGVVGHSIAD